MMNAFVENVKRKISKKVVPAKDGDKKKKKRPKKKKEEILDDSVPGTVYVAHIPHGFYEKEMRKYFSQFGKVLRLRVARSRKTGGAKGFAYIEFECSEVAKIVAETMNNYLFFEKLLKCEYVPPEKLHPNAFKGWKRGALTSRTLSRFRQNHIRSDKAVKSSRQRRTRRLKKLRNDLKEQGISFNIEPLLQKK
ncbi:MKI67 FHA domain-interacting nucleolar phosphoprotein-like [Uloborus diversus]|uniref:MKI67 FHA domain-interacting nucleolar phosphoprotein-like n=1 Tax=Uloborus diversus TaxID=327109 RepID=UPI0024099F6C|nr:MKI67 FHA domain-interacting nucleolar phosphoprotein-like [Uloborus diversus]